MIFGLCFTLAGCGNDKKEDNGSKTDTNNTSLDDNKIDNTNKKENMVFLNKTYSYTSFENKTYTFEPLEYNSEDGITKIKVNGKELELTNTSIETDLDNTFYVGDNSNITITMGYNESSNSFAIRLSSGTTDGSSELNNFSSGTYK